MGNDGEVQRPGWQRVRVFEQVAQKERQTKLASIVKKRGLKPGMRELVIAAPFGYMKSLAPLPEGIAVSESIGGTNDFVQFFATRKSEIEKSAKRLLQSSAPGALVWITYPKKTSGMDSELSREEVWAAMEGTGWRPVTQIAINEVWSAPRFRPKADVKSSRRATK